jgi:hypothetical protein
MGILEQWGKLQHQIHFPCKHHSSYLKQKFRYCSWLALYTYEDNVMRFLPKDFSSKLSSPYSQATLVSQSSNDNEVTHSESLSKMTLLR